MTLKEYVGQVAKDLKVDCECDETEVAKEEEERLDESNREREERNLEPVSNHNEY